jgi:hypothetical protein
VPTPTPKATPKPTPTPTPPQPIVTSFSATVGTAGVVTFSGTYQNATDWMIVFGDGTSTPFKTGPVTGNPAATHTYIVGDYYPYLVVKKGALTSTHWAIHIAVNF